MKLQARIFFENHDRKYFSYRLYEEENGCLRDVIDPPESLWKKNSPKSEIYSEGPSYDFSYDVKTKNPSWVLEVLKKEEVSSYSNIGV